MTKKEYEDGIKELNSGDRVPSSDSYSDFNSAKSAVGAKWSNAEVKHLHACIFGENEGPDWMWIIEFRDGDFGYMVAGCDYTGWGCQDGGTDKRGFKTAEEALEAIPVEDYDKINTERRKEILRKQLRGEVPYGLDPNPERY